MSNSGLKQARELTGKGFFYDNLVRMAGHCREDTHTDTLVSAYILNRAFMQIADELGDGPVSSSDLRRLEARYRTALNLVLETAVAGAPREEQDRRLIDLIQLLWTD